MLVYLRRKNPDRKNHGCQHCKKRLSFFLSLAGMSLTKLSLAGNNLIIPTQGVFGYIPAGDGKYDNFFTV
jgi:hypothetical protein